jgi:hypothetical protein
MTDICLPRAEKRFLRFSPDKLRQLAAVSMEISL